MGFENIVNLLDSICDEKDFPRFVTKKWIKVYDNQVKIMLPMILELKTTMLDQIYAFLVMHVLLKELLPLQEEKLIGAKRIDL